MRTSNIKLHIEELVLHGFAPGDRYTIADAVERELARLLTERFSPITAEGIAQSSVHRPANSQLDAGTFQVAPGSRSDSIGLQIAQAVHGGLIK
jgi:hypothetical protein